MSDIQRIEAAMEAADELAASLRDLRDEKLPGSVPYLRFDKAVSHTEDAKADLSGVHGILRQP